jgi:hypothetical protein
MPSESEATTSPDTQDTKMHRNLSTGDGIAIFAFVGVIVLWSAVLLTFLVMLSINYDPATDGEFPKPDFWTFIIVAFFIAAPYGWAGSRINKILNK